jgi:hypothetical protein
MCLMKGTAMRKETYDDWLQTAITVGIDRDDPSPEEMLTAERYIATLEDAPEHLAEMPDAVKTLELARHDRTVSPSTQRNTV